MNAQLLILESKPDWSVRLQRAVWPQQLRFSELRYSDELELALEQAPQSMAVVEFDSPSGDLARLRRRLAALQQWRQRYRNASFVVVTNVKNRLVHGLIRQAGAEWVASDEGEVRTLGRLLLLHIRWRGYCPTGQHRPYHVLGLDLSVHLPWQHLAE